MIYTMIYGTQDEPRHTSKLNEKAIQNNHLDAAIVVVRAFFMIHSRFGKLRNLTKMNFWHSRSTNCR